MHSLGPVPFLVLTLLLSGPSLSGQVGRSPASPRVGVVLPPAHHDPALSLRLLGALARAEPDRLEWRLSLAREATTLGITAGTSEGRKEALRAGVEAGREAVARAAEDADAHYWLAASLGLLADEEGGRTKISLAREAYVEARRALELSPDHPGAHHILGRLHAGTVRLSWLSRMIARGLGLGAIVDDASLESAEEHLRHAFDADPGPLVHAFELAKLLVETGEGPEEGRALLEELAARRSRYPLDTHYIRRAAALLASVRTEGGR